VLAAAGLLAVPGTALGARITHTLLGGKSDPDVKSIGFDLIVKRGEPKALEDVEVSYFFESCANGAALDRQTWRPLEDVPVKGDGDFKIVDESPLQKYTFKGEVREDGKVKGRFTAGFGHPGEGTYNCNTAGALKFMTIPLKD
jgi:hypothetical protein